MAFVRESGVGVGTALMQIGEMHLGGRAGLQKDAAEARRWLERAVAAGEPSGHVWLGIIHRDGLDGPPSGQRALHHFGLAADSGDVDGMFYAAQIFARGTQDVAPDERRAIDLFQRAAQAGDREAEMELQRRGVPVWAYTPPARR